MLHSVVSAAALVLAAAAPADWRSPDPDNTLVIDTSNGRIVVELRPELAPRGVERIKLLARANSEIFFMRAPARRLDHEYTVVGRVVAGLDVVRGLAVGEPPSAPDRMLKVRVADDLPPAECPAVQVLDERGPAFGARVAELRRVKGPAFTMCDVEIPSRGR